MEAKIHICAKKHSSSAKANMRVRLSKLDKDVIFQVSLLLVQNPLFILSTKL